MSGPKTGKWCIVSESEPHITWPEAQNVLREYLGKIMSLRDKLIALQKKHPELVIHYGVEDMRTDLPESGQIIVDELNNRLDIYRRLRGEITRVEGLIALRRSLLAMAKSLSLHNAATKHQPRNIETETKLENLRQTALRVAERVPPELSAAEKGNIKALLASIMAYDISSEFQLETLVDSLRLEVDRRSAQAREAARQRESQAKEAGRLATALLGVGTQAAEEIVSALRCVEAGGMPLTDSLCAQATKEIELARREQDCRKAASIMRQSLIKLGYGVEDDFTAAFVSGGKGYFQHSRWADHYCRLSVCPETNVINFDVVRVGDGEATTTRDESLEDVAVERQWCSLFPELIREMHTQGLEYDPVRACPPGALPMQKVNDPQLQSHRQQRVDTITAPKAKLL